MRDVKDELKQKVLAIQEQKSKAVLLLDILQLLNEENSLKVKVKAVHSLLKGWNHVIRRGDFKDDSEKYVKWLNGVFDETWSKMSALIGRSEDKRLAQLCLSSLMTLLSAKSTSWTDDEVQKLRSVLAGLMVSKETGVVDRFREYLEYTDVKFETIKILGKIVHSAKEEPSKNTVVFRRNAMRMLEILNYDSSLETALITLLCHEGEKVTYKFDSGDVRKSFTNLWLDFLHVNSQDVGLYRRILIILHETVMPHINRPLLLTDFLMDSYNVGGSISLLSLNGVFHLIHKHNLEYPEFYKKLYALFTPDVLHAKYKARFFHLADLFLRSSHLPEYLVASFLKRMCRLTLTAPANSLIMALQFIGNLFIRHPGLQSMMKADNDVYDFEEPDPKLTRAAESNIWEIVALQSHVLPQVSQAAKFVSKQLPAMEWNVSEHLEDTFEDMMEVESKKKVFVNVPLTFERPAGFKFQKNEITATLFE